MLSADIVMVVLNTGFGLKYRTGECNYVGHLRPEA